MRGMEALVDALSALGWRLLALVQPPGGGGGEKGAPLGEGDSFASTLLSFLGSEGSWAEELAKVEAEGRQLPSTPRQAQGGSAPLGGPSGETAASSDEGGGAEAGTAPPAPAQNLEVSVPGRADGGPRRVAAPSEVPGSRVGEEKRAIGVGGSVGRPEAAAGISGGSHGVETVSGVNEPSDERESKEGGDVSPPATSKHWTRPARSDAKEGRDVPFPDTSGATLTHAGAPGPEAALAGAAPPAAPPGTRPKDAAKEVVHRDLSLLDPVFRQRLVRVMERMEKEEGYRVELLEGYRSPERQEALFRQGRTEPGQVVTWTRNSLHTRGRAADLLVNGRWDYHEGYEVLQRIAREEGLHTLGSRDPGHVELREGEGPGGGGPEKTVFRGPVPGVARLPRMAEARPAAEARGWRPLGATPAAVAQVATVAPVPGGRLIRDKLPARGPAEGPTLEPPPSAAPVPAPGVEGVSGRWERSAGVGVPAAGFEGPPAAMAPEGKGTTAGWRARAAVVPPDSGVQGPPLSQGTALQHGDGGPAAQGADRAALPQDLQSPTASPPSRGVRPPLPPGQEGRAQTVSSPYGPYGVPSPEPGFGEGGERVGPEGPPATGRALELAETREAWGSAGRLHLELEDLDGEGTRLRLALRGGRLDGVLELQDPWAAARIRLRVGELHEALLRHGLDGRNLAVRGPGNEVQDVGPMRRGSVGQGDSWSTRSDSPWHRERGKERGS